MARRLYLLFFILFAMSLNTYSQDNLQNDLYKGSRMCSEKRSRGNLRQLANFDESKANVPHSFDILNYKMYIDLYANFISPYPKTFKANEIITLRVDSTLNFISLNAVNTSLAIDSVTGPVATFSHASNILKINLDRTYNAGEQINVRIYFRHLNVSDNAFYVSGGFVFTDAEPEGARSWFPCWDKPSDKATLDITIKSPATAKVASNGRLADSTKNVDTIYYHWVSRDPIATYLMVITGKVGFNLDILKWVYPAHPQDTLPIRLYSNANETITPALKSAILGMTTRYSDLFGEHPFEKNGFAALNSQFSWGGMENQSLTSICPGCWGENLCSHEYAHQWFGDMISPATWADIWLNEGFATWCEAVWVETSGGYTAYKNSIVSDANSYLSGNPGWAISNPDWAVTTPNTNTLFNFAITYAKGSCVLHLLRYVMGDTKFFAGMKSYGTDTNFRYKNAKISDFNAKMSSFMGEDLSWFFNAWLLQPNHPTYQVQYYIVPNNGGWQSKINIKQTQTNAGFFKMPIEVKYAWSGGGDTTFRITNDMANQDFYFQFSRQPISMTFDPNNNIVLKTASTTQVTPVELTSFTADAKDNFVVLIWRTASEINNKGFAVERSRIQQNGAVTWQEVKFIEGNGTSTIKNEYSYVDYLTSFGKYNYRLKQMDFDGTFSYSPIIEVQAGNRPETYALHQNYPNPFNPTTQIKFDVPENTRVKIEIFNSLGQSLKVLVDENFETGSYERAFDASKLASGVYFYSLITDKITLQNKMILMK